LEDNPAHWTLGDTIRHGDAGGRCLQRRPLILAAYFFDSSALAKLYHPEIGTPLVDQIIQSADNAIRISRLTVVEVPSVLAIKVRTHFLLARLR